MNSIRLLPPDETSTLPRYVQAAYDLQYALTLVEELFGPEEDEILNEALYEACEALDRARLVMLGQAFDAGQTLVNFDVPASSPPTPDQVA